MDISSIAGSLIGQSFGTHAAPESEPVANAFKQANRRIEQQLDSTQVKLSAYGQIKSAFAETQTAGHALADMKKTAPAADVKKAATNFIETFNKASKAVAGAIQGDGKQAGALAGEARAQLAATDLRRSLTQGSSVGDLKKVGITQNKDGSLAMDAKAFDKALQENPDQVRNTLARIGGRIEATAAGELANNGNVGASVSKLGSRVHSLEAQQGAQQAAQGLVAHQGAQINGLMAALAAYQRTFNS